VLEPKSVVEQNDQLVLAKYEIILRRFELYNAVQATRLRLDISVPNFFAIVERFNPHSRTFFTPVGEMGLPLHEMWEVSKLPMGSMPYEEYFPTNQELRQLAKDSPELYEVYQELMCHFYICMDIHRPKGNIIGQKS